MPRPATRPSFANVIDWRVAAQRHVEPVPIPKMLPLAGAFAVVGAAAVLAATTRKAPSRLLSC